MSIPIEKLARMTYFVSEIAFLNLIVVKETDFGSSNEY